MWDGLGKLVNRKRWIIHRIVHCPLDIFRLKQAVVLYVFLRISQLFQKEKLVAVCQTNFSRNHAGDLFFLRKKRLFDFFLGISVTGHVCVNGNSTQFWGLPISRRKRYNWGRQLDIRGTSGGDEKYCEDGKMGCCLGYGMMRMIDVVHRRLHK